MAYKRSAVRSRLAPPSFFPMIQILFLISNLDGWLFILTKPIKGFVRGVPVYEALVHARMKANLSQAKLARRISTRQTGFHSASISCHTFALLQAPSSRI